ncbi:MAG: valine--tRNA ligase, partial [Candidatus Aenigmatarchaeota archaeon]
VGGLSVKEGRPEIESKIVEIDLDYSSVGPKYGDRVDEIEDALENNEWMLEDGRLEAAGVKLKPEEFEVVEEKKYTGEGEMVDDEVTLVVK